MLVPNYPLIRDGDPFGTQNPNGDEFCTHDGYEDGSNMMRIGMRRYNPVGNSPLTSLVPTMTEYAGKK
jgi:hypothetical protein